MSRHARSCPSARAERALDVLNFVLADVRYGLGPYAAIYLISGHGWREADVAFAFAFGGVRSPRPGPVVEGVGIRSAPAP